MHRRLVAGLLTAVAVAAGLRTVAPAGPRTVPMTVAARDLAAGDTVAAGDVTTTDVPPGAVPEGTLGRPAGHVLASAVRRGEPITDARLVGASLATAHPGLVALPVRLPDGAMAGLLEPGDRVDLYAVAATGDANAGDNGNAASTGSRRVAGQVLVLAVPPPDHDGASAAAGLSGRLVVVGVPDEDVPAVTDASVRSFLTFAFVH